MKRKLFYKEFIGNKVKASIFLVIVTVFLVVIGYLWVDIISEINDRNVADVTMHGKRDEKGYRYIFYEDLEPIREMLYSIEGSNKISVVESITRLIIYVEDINSLNSITYSVRGYDENWMRSHIVLKEGSYPVANNKEVLIGNYFAQMIDVSVGDYIGKDEYTLSSMEHVKIPICLEQNLNNYEFEEYRVTGIIDERMSDFNYSVVLPYIQKDSVLGTNTVELYFSNDDDVKVYRQFIEKIRNSKTSIGFVSENYMLKSNLRSEMILNALFSISFATMIIYLLLIYLCKGIDKKLGLLKSFGIKNRTITRVFAGGISGMVLISFVANIVIIKAICYIRNLQLMKFVGLTVEKYTYDYKVFLIQLAICVLIVLLVWVGIFTRIKSTPPNKCMQKQV
jgi:hypothetical protein